jgi:hypothetical protein
VPGGVAPMLFNMSGDVAFLLKKKFGKQKKIFCRQNKNFTVDEIFFLNSIVAYGNLLFSSP